MKTRFLLPCLIFYLLLLASCGDSSDPAPSADTATFRVDLQLTGDYKKFTKIVTIGGGDFKYTGTDTAMPTVLFDNELATAMHSYEAEGVRELNINATIGFSPVEQAPATMMLKITVFKNGKQVDTQTFAYDEESDAVTEFLNYKAR